MLDSKVLVLTFSPSQMVYSQGAFHTKAGFHLLGCQLFPTKTTAPGYHMPTASMRVFLKFSCKSGTGVPWLCVVIWLGRVCVLDSMLQLPKIQQVSSTPGPRSLASLLVMGSPWPHDPYFLRCCSHGCWHTVLLVLDEKAEIQHWHALFTMDDDGYDGSKCRRCNFKRMY